ncbi:MAG: hypothetical protein M3505_07095 [Verrucomicrobiota bacterium]|nr:hypothetical protein [Verrucomicrobiota bacterium]
MKSINIIVNTTAAIAALGIISCSKMESKPKLTDLPVAAQAAIKARVGDATIEEIEKETEKGQIVYQVEAKKNGTKIEFKVDNDGKIVEKD